jgi:hypothetical protein
MRRVAATFAVLFALVGLAAVAPMPAGACSCLARTLDEQVAAASTVFRGTVRSVSASDATFDVDRVYKGPYRNSATVSTGDPTSSCAVPIREARTYVVFARDRTDTLSTDLCSGTTDDPSLGERLTASFGTPSPSPSTTTVLASRPLHGVSRTRPVIVAAVMLAVVGVAFTIAARTRRRPRPLV